MKNDDFANLLSKNEESTEKNGYTRYKNLFCTHFKKLTLLAL